MEQEEEEEEVVDSAEESESTTGTAEATGGEILNRICSLRTAIMSSFPDLRSSVLFDFFAGLA